MLKFTWELDGSLKNCSSRYPIWAFPKHFLMGAIRRMFQSKSAQSIEPNWKFYIYFHMSSAHWFTVKTVPMPWWIPAQHNISLCSDNYCAEIVFPRKKCFISIVILDWEKIKITEQQCSLSLAWFCILFYMYLIVSETISHFETMHMLFKLCKNT